VVPVKTLVARVEEALRSELLPYQGRQVSEIAWEVLAQRIVTAMGPPTSYFGDHDEFSNEVISGAPESWDDDVAQESIVVAYVRELERRLDAAGISRERVADPEILDDIPVSAEGFMRGRMVQEWHARAAIGTRAAPEDHVNMLAGAALEALALAGYRIVRAE
jgi:hypothetical protein